MRLALVGADGWGDVRVGSTEGVVAFGRVDDTELRDLYAHAEALVLPSLWEGFGLPVAEALATGCRVACSDIPALRELAGEDATYFDPSSPEAISEGILQALTQPRPHSAPRDELGRRRGVGRRALARARAVSAQPLVLVDADTVGRGRTGDESYTVNLLRELPAAAPELALACVAARSVGAARGRAARRAQRCGSTSRIPTGASRSPSRRSRAARMRRSPTRTTSSRRACAARPS